MVDVSDIRSLLQCVCMTTSHYEVLKMYNSSGSGDGITIPIERVFRRM